MTKTSSANSSKKTCCSAKVKDQQFEEAGILFVRHSDQGSSQAFALPERMRIDVKVRTLPQTLRKQELRASGCH
jgi:hypothetical protein